MTDNEFICKKCGCCCSRPGYVYVVSSEISAIAMHLGMSMSDFSAKYLTTAVNLEDRAVLSLANKPDGGCVFLDGPLCMVYPVRPRQCADFPLVWRNEGQDKECPALRDMLIAGMELPVATVGDVSDIYTRESR